MYWTAREVEAPEGCGDLLREWADIDGRERRLGIERGMPILIDPVCRVDPRLAAFFRRSRFAFLAGESQKSYVKDYRLWFTFLWHRGLYWDEADCDDLDDYEAWRRRSPDNPRRIGGAKWARELAAFKLLYDWAVARGHLERSPVATCTVARRDGTRLEVAANRPKDVRASNVKWVTPRTFRLWRDIGLRGYDARGLPDPGWRGRNDGRNSAFADLLFDSGLRLREAGCLLTLEVPEAMAGASFCEGTVAAAIAKRRERMFYVSVSAVAAVAAYMATGRRAAVGRAQRAGRYEALRGKLVITRISSGRQRRVHFEDALGRAADAPINELDAEERRRLFLRGGDGLEPVQLWLTEGGMPMDYTSWEAVFAAGSERCARFGKPVWISPHTCRHSFALKMLVTLHRALDRRFGLSQGERDHVRRVYGDAFHLVKDLLGHRSEQTTRMIYLEPLNGLRLVSILDDPEADGLEAVLARVASASRLVMDLDPGQAAVGHVEDDAVGALSGSPWGEE